MLRIIVKHTFQNGPDSCGREFRTFDVPIPAVEEFIAKAYGGCEVIGVEVLPEPAPEAPHAE